MTRNSLRSVANFSYGKLLSFSLSLPPPSNQISRISIMVKKNKNLYSKWLSYFFSISTKFLKNILLNTQSTSFCDSTAILREHLLYKDVHFYSSTCWLPGFCCFQTASQLCPTTPLAWIRKSEENSPSPEIYTLHTYCIVLRR